MFAPKNNIVWEEKSRYKKRTSLIWQKLQNERNERNESVNYLDSDNLYSDKSSDQKEKNKNDKIKTQNNIKKYRNESPNNSNDDDDYKKKEMNYPLKIKGKSNKNMIRLSNNFHDYSQYKIKHTNKICLGNSLNDKNNNYLIKVPKFSVVQVENLISLEFNRDYERNVHSKNNNNIMNNLDDNLNETNIKENDGNQRNIIKKRSKSFFCCL